MVAATKSRRGRPPGETPKAPLGGKGRLLSANISQQTRELLENEAQRTGLSISQIADRWLSLAGEGNAEYLARFGGNPATAAALETLVTIWSAVQREKLEPAEERAAMLAASIEALPRLMPVAAPDNSMLADALRAVEVWEACRSVLKVVSAAGANDPVMRRAKEPADPWGVAGAELGGLYSLGANALGAILPAYQVLLNARETLPDATVVAALEALRAAGDTARDEIDRALELARTFVDQRADRFLKQQKAELLGRAIAKASLGISR